MGDTKSPVNMPSPNPALLKAEAAAAAAEHAAAVHIQKRARCFLERSISIQREIQRESLKRKAASLRAALKGYIVRQGLGHCLEKAKWFALEIEAGEPDQPLDWGFPSVIRDRDQKAAAAAKAAAKAEATAARAKAAFDFDEEVSDKYILFWDNLNEVYEPLCKEKVLSPARIAEMRFDSDGIKTREAEVAHFVGAMDDAVSVFNDRANKLQRLTAATKDLALQAQGLRRSQALAKSVTDEHRKRVLRQLKAAADRLGIDVPTKDTVIQFLSDNDVSVNKSQKTKLFSEPRQKGPSKPTTTRLQQAEFEAQNAQRELAAMKHEHAAMKHENAALQSHIKTLQEKLQRGMKQKCLTLEPHVEGQRKSKRQCVGLNRTNAVPQTREDIEARIKKIDEELATFACDIRGVSNEGQQMRKQWIEALNSERAMLAEQLK